MAGIYVHIPFCKKACHYCNFHFSTSLATKDAVIEAIIAEISLKRDFLGHEKIDSIYFGGGTPSILKNEDIEKILNHLSKIFELGDNPEITLECNPDDISASKINAYKLLNINRLSIGIQSFFDEDLLWMGRAHNSAQAENAIKQSQDSGIHNITIDLIYGSPSTSHDMWENNLAKAIQFEIPHISSYCLTVEERTALSEWIKKGKMVQPESEKGAKQFKVLMKTLKSSGYDHYEISNFAKEGFEAIHNTNYWKGVPYIGIGPSAHSYYNEKRSWNIANNVKYVESIQKGNIPEEYEIQTPENRYNEYIMTGLRTKWGVDLEYITSMGDKIAQHFQHSMHNKQLLGLLQQDANIITLTEAGIYFADRVAMELFIEN